MDVRRRRERVGTHAAEHTRVHTLVPLDVFSWLLLLFQSFLASYLLWRPTTNNFFLLVGSPGTACATRHLKSSFISSPSSRASSSTLTPRMWRARTRTSSAARRPRPRWSSARGCTRYATCRQLQAEFWAGWGGAGRDKVERGGAGRGRRGQRWAGRGKAPYLRGEQARAVLGRAGAATSS